MMLDEPLVARCGAPLLGLGRVELPLDEHLVCAALDEVIARRTEHVADGVRWGYLLGVERAAIAARFAAAWRLSDVILASIAAPLGRARRVTFGFSFCKAYRGAVLPDGSGVHGEGLHIDTHPELAERTDLLRVLVNLGTSPRRFRFGDATRLELAARGLHDDRSSFAAAHVAPHVDLHDVDIPARDGRTVSFLLFWASIVPHVGVTESPGYFLYSFEGVGFSPLYP